MQNSSVLRLNQPNYYAYFYLKGSICPMSMKLSRKFVIGVVINSITFWSRDPKTTYNVYILYSKMRNIYTSKF